MAKKKRSKKRDPFEVLYLLDILDFSAGGGFSLRLPNASQLANRLKHGN